VDAILTIKLLEKNKNERQSLVNKTITRIHLLIDTYFFSAT